MKICPNCQKELQDAAIKCKYCDHKFEPSETRIPESIPEERSTRSITDTKSMQQKTKKCTNCAMEIPVDANVCPYCRKSTNSMIAAGEGLMNTGKQITTIVVSLVIIIVIGFILVSVLSK